MPVIGISIPAVALANRGGVAPDVPDVIPGGGGPGDGGGGPGGGGGGPGDGGGGPGDGGGGGGPGPDWPQDAVALWLILGQSNAEGYAPWRQDPAKSDAANAVAALSGEERATHPWLRLTTRSTADAIAAGNGQAVGQFPASGQGLATDSFPRTSGKVWGETLGIPAGTQCFGPEVGLVRHVLGGHAADGWRNDADPRLYVIKQVEGGQSVDHFRWGGEGQAILLNALRQGGGQNLETLAAAKTVLLQGVIFVIGEKDANNVAPTGGTMAATLPERFADWVRQVRGALGHDLPVAFCETYDEIDANKTAANQALATLAAGLSNAAVIERTPDWTHIGDNVHYDAQGQDALGAAAFGHFRDAYGRAGDGLVTDFPFTGVKPWFHVPPVFIDDVGGQMKLAATASEAGLIIGQVTPVGAPVPSAEDIYAAYAADDPTTFGKSGPADAERIWFSGNPARFAGGQSADVHFVARNHAGVLGEVFTTTRAGGVFFAPDLSLVGGSVTAAAATATAEPRFTGVVSWALHEGDRPFMRGEDVEAMAFSPVAAGVEAAVSRQTLSIQASGLASGTTYTLFATARRTSDDLMGVTQKVVFTTL